MSGQYDPTLGINSWLEDELYQQYLHDHKTVDDSWKHRFETEGEAANGGGVAVATQTAVAPADVNGTSAPVVSEPVQTARPEPGPGEQIIALRGAAARIAENMTQSLSIPVATSQRIIAVKVIDENRRVINQHRSIHGDSKVSYTHLVGWAIAKRSARFPRLTMPISSTKVRVTGGSARR